jgi:hypothetical protein
MTIQIVPAQNEYICIPSIAHPLGLNIESKMKDKKLCWVAKSFSHIS